MAEKLKIVPFLGKFAKEHQILCSKTMKKIINRTPNFKFKTLKTYEAYLPSIFNVKNYKKIENQ